MKPVQRRLVTEVVIERIVDFIRENRLGPGARLPNEHEFLKTLGVSRPTLREALRSLAVTGMIDLQPGSGIFVGKPQAVSLLAHGPVPSLITEPEEVQDFIEARRALEPQIAALAALKATEEDLRRILGILERMEQTVADRVYDDKPWVDFHVALFDASHNRLLVEMTTPIVAMLAQLTPYMITAQSVKASEEDFRRKILVHRKLYDAICSRNPEVARQAAAEHVEDSLVVSLNALELMRENAGSGKPKATEP